MIISVAPRVVKNFLLAILSVFFIGCSNEPKPTTPVIHFDLPGYFNAEVARLKSKNQLVKKTIQHNYSYQTEEIIVNDWSTELAPFLAADLNLKGIVNWIKVDTIRLDDGVELQYNSLDPETYLRQCNIRFLGA